MTVFNDIRKGVVPLVLSLCLASTAVACNSRQIPTRQAPQITIENVIAEMCGTMEKKITPEQGMTLDYLLTHGGWLDVANKYGVSYNNAIEALATALKLYNGEGIVNEYNQLQIPDDGIITVPVAKGSPWCSQASY